MYFFKNTQIGDGIVFLPDKRQRTMPKHRKTAYYPLLLWVIGWFLKT